MKMTGLDRAEGGGGERVGGGKSNVCGQCGHNTCVQCNTTYSHTYRHITPHPQNNKTQHSQWQQHLRPVQHHRVPKTQHKTCNTTKHSQNTHKTTKQRDTTTYWQKHNTKAHFWPMFHIMVIYGNTYIYTIYMHFLAS